MSRVRWGLRAASPGESKRHPAKSIHQYTLGALRKGPGKRRAWLNLAANQEDARAGGFPYPGKAYWAQDVLLREEHQRQESSLTLETIYCRSNSRAGETVLISLTPGGRGVQESWEESESRWQVLTTL